MAYKKQKGGPKMYRKDKSPMEMASPAKNYKNPQDYKVFNMGNEPTPMEMHGKHDGPKMEKTPTYMKSSGFKMKSGSPFQRNFGVGASPVKNYSVEKGSHDHPHGDKKSPMEMASPMKVAGGKYVMEEDKEGYPVGTQISTADYERLEQRNRELEAEAEKASEVGDSAKAEYLYGQTSWLTKTGLEDTPYSTLDEAREALDKMDPNSEEARAIERMIHYELGDRGKGETEKQRRLDMMDQ